MMHVKRDFGKGMCILQDSFSANLPRRLSQRQGTDHM
jgi:hypothetical protein